MGYFVLTTISMLDYLGYVPIPNKILVCSWVVFVMYDAFKR
jgi:hypothetical protein